MKFILSLFTAASLKFPRITITLSLLISFLALFMASRGLKFDTNQDNLISKSADYFQNYQNFLKEFGDWEYIYVVIKTSNYPENAKAISRELTKRLKERPDLFASVTEKIDISGLRRNGLLLLPEKEFSEFEKKILPLRDDLGLFLKLNTSADWYTWVNNLLEKPGSLGDPDTLKVFWDFFKNGIAAPFDAQAAAELSSTKLMSDATGFYLDRDGFLFSGNGKLLFLQILPHKNYSEMEIIREPLEYLRLETEKLRKTYPQLELGITGRPVLQNDEAVSTGNDSQWASIGSLIFVSALFLFFVKDLRLSIFSLIALGAGIALSTGIVHFAIGSVNLLTIVFAVILIGMGLDYGIHFMLHYQLLKNKYQKIPLAIEEALKDNGEAILLGAGMTSIGFATAMFTDFLGLQQLGFIISVGILISCIMQLTLFPALIRLFDRPTIKTEGNLLSSFDPLVRLALKSVENPRGILILSFLLVLGCLPLMMQLRFDYNLLKLQDPEQESVRFEKLIEEESEESTWFLSAATADKTQLKSWNTALQKLTSVGRTDSILNLIPDYHSDRLNRIESLRQSINNATPSSPPDASWITEMTRLSDNLAKLANTAFSSGDAEAYQELSSLSVSAKDNLDAFNNSPFFHPPEEIAFRFALNDLQNLFTDLLNPKKMTENDFSETLLKRYKSSSGRYSLAIYPKDDIWEWEALEKFINDVKNVIPDVTGAPITTYESAIRMNNGFRQIGILTSIVVLILLILAFREIKTPLIIMMSLALTFIFLFGFMVIADIPLNLANFFALPILIGSNVDHGIYMFHHYRDHRSLNKLFHLTVPPVFLSCFTNIAGFATLALVRHRGLAGFGSIMAMGTLISLLVTAVWIPCVIRVFYEKKTVSA